MREEYGKYKIAIYGSKKDINIARSMLDNLNLTGIEPTDRLIIQKYIDLNNLKADILYDGNGVWSYKKVIRDFKRALNSKSCKKNEYGSGEYDLTNYIYDFLHLCCGSIAHYNKYGWIGTYPTKNELKLFIRENEFGHDIVREQPEWKTDCIRIAKELLRIVNM